MTTRHWAVTDCDAKNERHPTLAQYLDEVERGKEHAQRIRPGFIECEHRLRRRPFGSS
jgi:hypothetical protein